ncbi:MAG: hypothetical protein ACSHXK_03030 [Oceanococcus sp.]
MFSLLHPAFEWLDSLLAGYIFLPGRIVLWAALSGLFCTWLFSVVFPRKRVEVLKQQMAQANAAMRNTEMEWDEASKNIKRALSAAFQNAFFRFLPTLVAAIPALSILTWLDQNHTYTHPEVGEELVLSYFTKHFPDDELESEVRSVFWPNAESGALMLPLGTKALQLTLAASASDIYEQSLYHKLLPNPMGYLPSESVFQHVKIHFSIDGYAAFFPSIPKWVMLFFPVFISISLALHFAWRLF